MSKLLGAMKLKIREIVLVEERPFTFADFREFEVTGQKYHMTDGTFRNNISKLRKSGVVQIGVITPSESYLQIGVITPVLQNECGSIPPTSRFA